MFAPMALIHVKVVPGASRDRVAGRYGDGVKVQVSAPPEGGKANRSVERVIAEALGVRPQQVRVVKGHTTARKVVEVEGVENLLARLGV
jgi:uncharacterized protein (TIGR00251 family)